VCTTSGISGVRPVCPFFECRTPDITEHPTAEGKLYLCAVKDVYSGRIVGYSMDSRMKSSRAVAALENAVRSRRPAGTVVHSDR
jgi:transposase InsO family protein